ncbi:MAG: hypothetical protein AAB733_04745, partial [Patescibacteria group bacterium]
INYCPATVYKRNYWQVALCKLAVLRKPFLDQRFSYRAGVRRGRREGIGWGGRSIPITFRSDKRLSPGLVML